MYAGQNRREHDKDTTNTNTTTAATAVTAPTASNDSIHVTESSNTIDHSTCFKSAPSDAPTKHTIATTTTNTSTTKHKSYKHKTNTSTVNDVKRDIFENFKSYGLSPPELIRLDNHLCDKHYYVNSNRHNSDPSSSTSSQFSTGYFDLIITDPPYGIRAGAKKCGECMYICMC